MYNVPSKAIDLLYGLSLLLQEYESASMCMQQGMRCLDIAARRCHTYQYIMTGKNCQNQTAHLYSHLRKPRVLSPLRSLRVRNEVDLVPLACENGVLFDLHCLIVAAAALKLIL